MTNRIDMAGCPVDHSQVDSKENALECPVDHNDPEAVKKWLDHGNGGEGLPPLNNIPKQLSSQREVSSIPRAGKDGNWIYPSQQQFYSAMLRKNYSPEARDMATIIPIHNAVNEKAWAEILKWEKGKGITCGGPKLVSFSGDSSKLSPKARWNMLLGDTRPFDRHDWVIDRCGTRVDYIIDFYTGTPDQRHPERPSFYLDARPKLNSWEGVKMRLLNVFGP